MEVASETMPLPLSGLVWFRGCLGSHGWFAQNHNVATVVFRSDTTETLLVRIFKRPAHTHSAPRRCHSSLRYA